MEEAAPKADGSKTEYKHGHGRLTSLLFPVQLPTADERPDPVPLLFGLQPAVGFGDADLFPVSCVPVLARVPDLLPADLAPHSTPSFSRSD